MKTKKIFEKFTEDSDPISDMGIGMRPQISKWMKEIREKDTDDNALIQSAKYGKLDFIKYLVQNGADIHAWYDLALRYASSNGHLEVVKYLVQNGANIHADNDYALQWASENGHLEVVKYLVQNGADIHADDDLALQWASSDGHLEVVKYLVQNGADIHADDDEALRWASENGHLEVVKYLKSQMKKDKVVKESLFEKFTEDSDPISDMGIGMRHQISQWMKEIREEDTEDTDDNALVYAAKYGKLDFIKYLVQNGADIHANNDRALRWASENGHLEVVKYLVQNGANIHADDDLALQWASQKGHLEVVKYLVQKGANIHADDDLALQWASENGHLEVVKYLESQIGIKESLLEKFIEDSDPIKDMGIGPEYLLTKRIENFIELIKRDPNINDRHLRKVNVWPWGLVVKLNKIYSSFNSHMRLVRQYIKEAKLDKYFKESSSSEGMWDTINVYFHVKPEYKKLFLNFKTNVFLNEKFVEDSDPISDIGIGIRYYIKDWHNKILKEDERLYYEQGIQTLQNSKLKLITPHIIRGIRLEGDKLYFALFFSMEIDKNGKSVNSIDHIKTVLKNLYLSEFVVFKSSSFKTAVFIIKPEYVNLFRNLEYLNEKFVEDSDPIADIGIGAIHQRTLKLKMNL